jgi:hypothetical protein
MAVQPAFLGLLSALTICSLSMRSERGPAAFVARSRDGAAALRFGRDYCWKRGIPTRGMSFLHLLVKAEEGNTS